MPTLLPSSSTIVVGKNKWEHSAVFFLRHVPLALLIVLLSRPRAPLNWLLFRDLLKLSASHFSVLTTGWTVRRLIGFTLAEMTLKSHWREAGHAIWATLLMRTMATTKSACPATRVVSLVDSLAVMAVMTAMAIMTALECPVLAATYVPPPPPDSHPEHSILLSPSPPIRKALPLELIPDNLPLQNKCCKETIEACESVYGCRSAHGRCEIDHSVYDATLCTIDDEDNFKAWFNGPSFEDMAESQKCCTADEGGCGSTEGCQFSKHCERDWEKPGPPCERKYFSEESCNLSGDCTWSHGEGRCVDYDACRVGGRMDNEDLCNASGYCRFKAQCERRHDMYRCNESPRFQECCDLDKDSCSSSENCSYQSECVLHPDLAREYEESTKLCGASTKAGCVGLSEASEIESVCVWDSSYNYCSPKFENTCYMFNDRDSCESESSGRCTFQGKCKGDYSTWMPEEDSCYGKGKDDCSASGECSYHFHCHETAPVDHSRDIVCGSAGREECLSPEYNSTCAWEEFQGSSTEAYANLRDHMASNCAVLSSLVEVSPGALFKPLDVCTLVTDENGEAFCPDRSYSHDIYEHCRMRRDDDGRNRFSPLAIHFDNECRPYEWLKQSVGKVAKSCESTWKNPFELVKDLEDDEICKLYGNVFDVDEIRTIASNRGTSDDLSEEFHDENPCASSIFA